MNIITQPLNSQTLILELAETEIRSIVKNDYISRVSKTETDTKIANIIKKAIDKITIERLKQAAAISLLSFYHEQYSLFSTIPINVLIIATALSKVNANERLNEIERQTLRTNNIRIKNKKVYSKAYLYGVPTQKFQKTYYEKEVRPKFQSLLQSTAKDPNDISNRNTLRNLAEMEVRYDNHLKQIQDLKERGVKLVIASTHADCSERCAPFQGRVYSLDGTSGTTSDGRRYVPLEVATDIYYTTKKGITYKNGLLGFNCRHYLVEYKDGFSFPKPNAKEEKKEYAITIRQRQLEKKVREYRNEALLNKDVNKNAYLEAKQKAESWNNLYIQFSRQNGRAYYPSRTKVI